MTVNNDLHLSVQHKINRTELKDTKWPRGDVKGSHTLDYKVIQNNDKGRNLQKNTNSLSRETTKLHRHVKLLETHSKHNL